MKIIIMEPLGISQDDLQVLINNLGDEVIAYDSKTTDPNEQIKRAKDADVLIIANTPLTGEVIDACPNLKMISVAFVGVDHVDLEVCKARNIVISNAAEYCTHAVAELALGLTLSVLRNIPRCDNRTRSLNTKDGLIGHELYKKTFGVVGTGAIGIKTAQLAHAFGCKVLAYSRTEKQELLTIGVTYLSLEELLQQSDIVSLHTPLTEATKNLINQEKLDLMKTTSILINTARGPIVDNGYLSTCLSEGRLAGAGIDVFDIEPPLRREDTLINNENAVLTPHIAYATHESILRRARIVFDNITAYKNNSPQNVMN